jgi:hypothetical protein
LRVGDLINLTGASLFYVQRLVEKTQ